MSHFSVLVITNEFPSDEVLSAALAPFHEFECTGRNDQYVIDVDKTDEYRAEFDAETTSRFRAADGTLHSPYDDRFYREFTDDERAKVGPLPLGTGAGHGMSWTSKDWGDGQGYRSKVHFCPEGFERVDVPHSEVMTFVDWLESWHGLSATNAPDTSEAHKYGYALINDSGAVIKAVKRTNPNKKWDWWQLGGRYQGRLLPLDAAETRAGSPGLMGSRDPNGGVDVCRVGNLDIETMRQRAVARAAERYDRRMGIVAGRPVPPPFGTIRDVVGHHAAAIAMWRAHPVVADFATKPGDDPDGWMSESDWAELRRDRESVLASARLNALSAFAILQDGQWRERGEMGWFGAVFDEKDPDAWQREFAEVFGKLPPTAWLTFVDCHI